MSRQDGSMEESESNQSISDRRLSPASSSLDEVQTAMSNLFGETHLHTTSSLDHPSFATTDLTAVRTLSGIPTHSRRKHTTAFEINLLTLLQTYDWLGALARVQTHPWEASLVGAEGRMALHLACDLDAPSLLVKAILQAYPKAATMVGTSHMTPLHITCSSVHASLDVVLVLLQTDALESLPWASTGPRSLEGLYNITKDRSKLIWNSTFLTATAMKDIDGDTPLHAACRCGAPLDVLEVLVSANPTVVHERDKEGLTPILRLWVRYFVCLGEDTIQAIVNLQGSIFETVFYGTELFGAWKKTLLLLHAAFYSTEHNTNSDSTKDNSATTQNPTFRAVHVAAALDCPRLILKLTTLLYPNQLDEVDHMGYNPLMIAAMAPVYKVHNLGGDGYAIEDPIYGDYNTTEPCEVTVSDTDAGPSVIDIILSASPSNAPQISHSPSQRLPLILAILSGKRLHEGLKALLMAYPDALMFTDPVTGLYPFMLAASVGTCAETKLHDDLQPVPKADLSTIFELLRCNPEAIRWGYHVEKI
jgi:hypothetical protein